MNWSATNSFRATRYPASPPSRLRPSSSRINSSVNTLSASRLKTHSLLHFAYQFHWFHFRTRLVKHHRQRSADPLPPCLSANFPIRPFTYWQTMCASPNNRRIESAANVLETAVHSLMVSKGFASRGMTRPTEPPFLHAESSVC